MDYPLSISGWSKGVDNVHADHELPQDTLRRGVNVDIMDSGSVRRRGGFAQIAAVVGAHSLWSDGVTAYYAQNNALHQIFENGVSASIGAFACALDRAAYVKVDDEVYITSRSARGTIRGGVVVPWGIDIPLTPPTLAVTTGILPIGTYHVTVTYLTADGRESGLSTMSAITLAAVGGLATTSLPNPADAAVTKKRLYMSTTDGEVLYLVAELQPTDQFVTMSVLPTGVELRTAYLTPPPLGVAVTYYNGRIFIVDAADPTVLWYTEATDYGHVNQLKNYYKFEKAITMIAGVDDGIYVASEQTWFIAAAGSPEQSRRMVLETGAIFGSATSIPNTTDAIWMSPRGAVVGKSSGAVEVLSGNQVSTGGMIDAAALVREQNSVRQYIVVGNNTEASALQAGSYAEAEIIRRSA